MEEQTGVRKEYENLSFQFGEEHPYDVMDKTSGTENEGPKTTHDNSQNLEELGTEIKDIQEEKESSLALKRLLVIILIIVSVAGFATMSTLFYMEKSTSNDNKGKENQIPASKIKAKKNLGSRGCSFLVTFIRSHIVSNETNRTILVTSDNDFHMNVTLSETQQSNLVSITTKRTGNVTAKSIHVHYSLVPYYFSAESKGVLISTSKVSSVLSLSDHEYVSGSTTIYPSDKLSTYYIISTSKPTNNILDSGSHFTIASLTDNTYVSIILSVDTNATVELNGRIYGNEDTLTLTLHKYQTFQIGLRADMSGTIIYSSSPVAVFAGNRCVKIGDFGYCSMLVEMVPPVDKLDKSFIVPPNIHRYETQVRMISAVQTEVIYTIQGIQNKTVLAKNQYLDFTVRENEIGTIQSAEPLLVNSFASGSASRIYGDPYMITIPGIHQYINEYSNLVPGGFNFSFATFMITENSFSNLQVNGSEIVKDNIVFNSTVILGGTLYRVLTISVPSGVIDVRTTDRTNFGFIVYGQRLDDGHGFSGNSLLPEN